MTEKEAYERIDYIDRRLAKKLTRLPSACSRAAFMLELFGRQAQEEFTRLAQIYPEILAP